LFSRDDLRAKIELPSCRQYKWGDFLAVRPLNRDELIDEDDDDDNWEDLIAPSIRRSRAGDENDIDDGEGEEDTHGSQKGTGKGKGTNDGNGKGNGNGKGTGKLKRIVKWTSGGDDISCAVALQLQKQMSEADLDKEGKLERVYLEPEASPAVSISSENDTESTELDSEIWLRS
jgi:hypothetical protein